MRARPVVAIVFGAILLLGGVVAIGRYGPPLGVRKPNILFVSICSLRQDRMGAYGYPRDTTPHIDEFAARSWIFSNGIGVVSWRKIGRYLLNLAPDSWTKLGYQPFGTKIEPEDIPYTVEMAVEDFQGDTSNLRELIDGVRNRIFESKRSEKPFFMSVHFKQLHFPYLGTDRNEFESTRYLSKSSQALLERYKKLAALPSPPQELIPLLTLLFGENSGEGPSASGLVSEERLLSRWKSSPDYKAGLSLANDIYDARLRYVDSMVKDVLNLWGDPELQKNTVVVLTGDHGTALMEHGYLIHGQTVYDEALRFPVLMHFPGQKVQRRFDEQISHFSLTRITELLMNDGREIRALDYFKETAEPLVYSRNCSRSIFSVRSRNEWKFITNLATGERELYDLVRDPFEQQNIVDEQVGLATQLEEKLSLAIPSMESKSVNRGIACNEGS